MFYDRYDVDSIGTRDVFIVEKLFVASFREYFLNTNEVCSMVVSIFSGALQERGDFCFIRVIG